MCKLSPVDDSTLSTLSFPALWLSTRIHCGISCERICLFVCLFVCLFCFVYVRFLVSVVKSGCAVTGSGKEEEPEDLHM